MLISLNKRRKRFEILFFLAPSLFGLILFQLIPFGNSLYLSLTDWDVLSDANFIGLQNYSDILRSSEFWKVLSNTFYFIILYIPGIIIVSLGLASLLNVNAPGKKFFRVVFYIPVLTSWVAAALLWRWLLSPYYGPINEILSFFGLTGPSWLYDKNWAMPGIVIASLWKDMGYFGLIFLSALQSIDKTYYEAARMDGASSLKVFFKITLPMISPTMFFVTIISIINSFQLFPQVMIMTEGGPFGSTQVMVERIYSYAFDYYKMGYASAFSWILFVFIFIATVVQLYFQKRWVHYEG